MTRFLLHMLLAIFAVLMPAAAPSAEDAAEQAALLGRQRVLEKKADTLRREQDYLLFQKTAFQLDSKYLVIRISKRAGQLRYKNRVLKDFRFLSASRSTARLAQGPVRLTRKIEGGKQQHALVFGSSFALQGKQPAGSIERTTPRIFLARKDLAAVFYALERGALAYVLP